MEKYSIEASPKTPYIIFDLDGGMLEIKGRSVPEDSLIFYNPLFDALAHYAANPKPVTTVNIELEYSSTSSSKCILIIFRQLEAINKAGSAVTINWHYEDDDEDMLEAGKDYQTLINVPFQMIRLDG